ncbi:MAG: carbonic anhydrase [Bryobacteraceae bacterium]
MRSIGVFSILVFSLGALAGAAALPRPVTPEKALSMLMAGNERYVAGHTLHPDQSKARQLEVEAGQAPFAVVLGCADSRVPPELIFDQGLGDLFVIRVAGNVTGDEITASMEYAVEHLGTSLIVVLGHEKCGAVTASVKGGEVPGHLPSIVGHMRPAVEEAKAMAGDAVSNCVRVNVQHVVRELSHSEPILKEMVESGKVKIVGARYDLHTGKVIPVED